MEFTAVTNKRTRTTMNTAVLAFAICGLAAASAFADADAWRSRIAVQQNHNDNVRGFQQFSRTLFNGMNNGSGGFNYGGGPSMEVAQLIQMMNNAIRADMSPVFKARFDNEVVAMGMQIQPGPMPYVQQQTLMLTKQLMDQYASRNGDDNQRAALTLYFTACGLSGRSKQVILTSLTQLVSVLTTTA